MNRPCRLVELRFYIVAIGTCDFWFETIYSLLNRIKTKNNQQIEFILKAAVLEFYKTDNGDKG